MHRCRWWSDYYTFVYNWYRSSRYKTYKLCSHTTFPWKTCSQWEFPSFSRPPISTSTPKQCLFLYHLSSNSNTEHHHQICLSIILSGLRARLRVHCSDIPITEENVLRKALLKKRHLKFHVTEKLGTSTKRDWIFFFFQKSKHSSSHGSFTIHLVFNTSKFWFGRLERFPLSWIPVLPFRPK